LSHTSGLLYSDAERRRKVTTLPGSTWEYSGLGYLIVQQALEETYGEPLDALLEAVAEPLGMRDTSYTWRDEGGKAVGYDRDGNWISPTVWGGANAALSPHTTVIEYACFVERVLADLTNRESTTSQLMLRPRIDVDASLGLAWGLGWGLARQADDVFFLHWSSNPGFKSLVVGSVESRRAMVVLTNSDNGLELATELAAMMFGQRYDFLDFYMMHPDD
jgi:CubicO group peptidase (beta-lactamase class C family)